MSSLTHVTGSASPPPRVTGSRKMKKPTPKQIAFWNIPREALEHGSPRHLEMRRLYGWGPEGARCGDCAHLIWQLGYSKRYFKCELSGITHGPASDWRKKWRACGAFTPKEEDES
jgi:hypothetical protein